MAEPFIGQIQAFGFNFAPRNWAKCNGQLLSINNHTALFSLLGTQYGGDGRTTFGLPDLQGRSMVHQGQGPGLNPTQMGQKGGQEYISLKEANLPPHNHIAQLNVADEDVATGTKAKNKAFSQNSVSHAYCPAPAFTEGNKMHPGVLTIHSSGGGQAFASRNPYQVVNICIALEGEFPSRS